MIARIFRALRIRQSDRARASLAAETAEQSQRRADRAERSRLAKEARARTEEIRLRECRMRFIGEWQP